jgi:CheY-like chemotaxis protein
MRRRVLLVEDDDDIREVLRGALVDEGYDVLVATDGGEALTLLGRQTHRCVVLLDLLMPLMNGWQFRAAQKRHPRLASHPVIVMTAGKVDRVPDVDVVMRKPPKLDVLIAEIERLRPGEELDEKLPTAPQSPVGNPDGVVLSELDLFEETTRRG